jgi:hypothetical protein
LSRGSVGQFEPDLVDLPLAPPGPQDDAFGNPLGGVVHHGEHLAAASPAEVRAAAIQAVQQEDPTLLPVLREQLVEWLTQTPAATLEAKRAAGLPLP